METQIENNEELDKRFNQAYEARKVDYNTSVNIALVGKVSSGKSSLLNAILYRSRSDALAEVGARSGVTVEIKPIRLDDNVLIVDCPGLDDIERSNSRETQDFLKEIDLGIFVVTGSVDGTQRANYENVKSECKNTIIVLNKVDEWDNLKKDAVDIVVEQWKKALDANHIFQTCTNGYDPDSRETMPMDIRGVDDVRSAIMSFLRKDKKDILLAKHFSDKSSTAIGIIATAVIAVAAEAFIPGSAVYITATQVVAIGALAYLYSGKEVSKTTALGVLPSLAGEVLGSSIFLWVKSLLPPTGIVDVAAALVAVSITFAMLAAVKWLFESGYSLEDKDQLKFAFKVFRAAGSELKGFNISDLKNPKSVISLVTRIIQNITVPQPHIS